MARLYFITLLTITAYSYALSCFAQNNTLHPSIHAEQPSWAYSEQSWNGTDIAAPTQTYGHYYEGDFIEKGDGSSANPFTLYYPAQWASLAVQVNNATNETDAGKNTYYRIMGEMNFGGYSFPSIGTTTKPFKGNLLGNGVELKGVFVNNTGGIFGTIVGGSVEYLGIGIGSNISFNSVGGAIVGTVINGVVSNCYNLGNINNSSDITGGIVGEISGNSAITCCFNRGEINGESFIGGIIGKISKKTIDEEETAEQLTITNCYNTGAIRGKNHLGGIAGVMQTEEGKERIIASIRNCLNVGYLFITITNGEAIGGIIGRINQHSILDRVYSNLYVRSCLSGSIIILINAETEKLNPAGKYRGSIVGHNDDDRGSLGSNFYDSRYSNFLGIGGDGTTNPDFEWGSDIGGGTAGITTQQITSNIPVHAGSNNIGIESGNATIAQWQPKSGYYPQLLCFSTPNATTSDVMNSAKWKTIMQYNSGMAAVALQFNGYNKLISVNQDFTIRLNIANTYAPPINWTSNDNQVHFATSNLQLPLTEEKKLIKLTASVQDILPRTFYFINNKRAPLVRPYWAIIGRSWGGNSVDATGAIIPNNKGQIEMASENQFGYWDETQGAFRGSGTGNSPEDPITIYYPAQLARIAYMTNKGSLETDINLVVSNFFNGETYYGYAGRYFRLMANLDMGGFGADNTPIENNNFTPIGIGKFTATLPGNSAEGLLSTDVFRGCFNGNGFFIQNLYIKSHYPYSGLFGKVEGVDQLLMPAQIESVTLEKGSLISSTSGGITGAIIGELGINTNAQYLVNHACNVESVAPSTIVGGVIGEMKSSASHLLNSGNVTSENNTIALGGVIGKITCSIENPLSEVIIHNAENGGNVKGTLNTGGIVGNILTNNSKTITLTHCYNTKSVKGYMQIGGIIGGANGNGQLKMNNCLHLASVASLGNGAYTGSIIGHVESITQTNFVFNQYFKQFSNYKGIGGATSTSSSDITGAIIPIINANLFFTNPLNGFDTNIWSKQQYYAPELKAFANISLPTTTHNLPTNAANYNSKIKDLSAILALPIYLSNIRTASGGVDEGGVHLDTYFDITKNFQLPYTDARGNILSYRITTPEKFILTFNHLAGDSYASNIPGNKLQIPLLSIGETFVFNIEISTSNGLSRTWDELTIAGTGTNPRPWWAQNGSHWSWQGAGKTLYISDNSEDLVSERGEAVVSLVTGDTVNASFWLSTVNTNTEFAPTSMFGFFHDGLRTFGDFNNNGVFIPYTNDTRPDGSINKPYPIYYPAQIAYLAQQVNNGTTLSGVYFILKKSLNMGGEGHLWVPIGYNGGTTNSFSGNFDGNTMVIEQLYVAGNYANAGLFGSINNTTLRNLGIGKGGTIHSTATNANIGGICGSINNVTITDCYNRANIVATISTANIGGITGLIQDNSSTINRSFNSGRIHVSNNANAGGIVGAANFTTTNASTFNIGNCINVGVIEAKEGTSGTSGSSGTLNLGGIIGLTNSIYANPKVIIANNINNGAVIGYGANANYGGIVGRFITLNTTSAIRNNLVTGIIRSNNVVNGTSTGYTGAIAGYRNTTACTLRPNAWDSQISYGINAVGNGTAIGANESFPRKTEQIKNNGLNLDIANFGFETGNGSTLYWAKGEIYYPELIAFKTHPNPIFKNISAFVITPITLDAVDKLSLTNNQGVIKNISTPVQDALGNTIHYQTLPESLVSTTGLLALPEGANTPISFSNNNIDGFSKTYTTLSSRSDIQHQVNMEGSKTVSSRTLPNLDENGLPIQEFDINLTIKGNNPLPPKKYDFIIVFDNSNSMYTNTYNGQQVINYAKNAMNTLIDDIATMGSQQQTDVKYSVVVYGTTSAARHFNTNSWSPNYTDGYTPMNGNVYTSSPQLAKNAISSIVQYVPNYGTGGTNTQAGYLMANKIANTRREGAQCVVIFMTDGVPTYYYTNTSTGTITSNSGAQTQPDDFNAALNAATSLAASPDVYVYNVGMLLGTDATAPAIQLSEYLMGLNPYRSNLTGNINLDYSFYANNLSYWTSAPRYAQDYLKFSKNTTNEEITQKFRDLVSSFSQYLIKGTITDVIPSNFQLTYAAEQQLILEGATILKDTPNPGETTITYPNVPLLPEETIRSYTISYVGSNSDPNADYGFAFTNENAVYECSASQDGTLTGNFIYVRPYAKLFAKTKNDYFNEPSINLEYPLFILENDPFSQALTIPEYQSSLISWKVILTDEDGNPKSYIEEEGFKAEWNEAGFVDFLSPTVGDKRFYYRVEVTAIPEGSSIPETIISPITEVLVLVGSNGVLQLGSRYMVSYPALSFPNLLLGRSVLPASVREDTPIWLSAEDATAPDFASRSITLLEFIRNNMDYRRFYSDGEEVPEGHITSRYENILLTLDGVIDMSMALTPEIGKYIVKAKSNAPNKIYTKTTEDPTEFDLAYRDALLIVRPTNDQHTIASVINNVAPVAFTGTTPILTIPASNFKIWEVALYNRNQNSYNSGVALQPPTSEKIHLITSDLLPEDVELLNDEKIRDGVSNVIGKSNVLYISGKKRYALVNPQNGNIRLHTQEGKYVTITIPYPDTTDESGKVITGSPIIIHYPEQNRTFKDIGNPLDYNPLYPDIISISGEGKNKLTILHNEEGTPTALQFKIDNFSPFVMAFVTDAVAMIVESDEYFLSLNAAFDEVTNGNTVRLLKNVREDITLSNNKFCYFDCNGKDMGDESENAAVITGNGILNVTPGSTLALEANDAKVNKLILSGSVFGNKSQLYFNDWKVIAQQEAYFDYNLRTTTTSSDPQYAWYPLTLPFDVDISSNITTPTLTTLSHPYDYAIAQFDGERRALYGVGNTPTDHRNDWQLISKHNTGMINANRGYMVRTSTKPTLRFYASNPANIKGSKSAALSFFTGNGSGIHQGWNYVEQPMGINSIIYYPNSGIIQVSENYSSDRSGIGKQGASYVAKLISTSGPIAPYTGFFYQASNSGQLEYIPAIFGNQVINASTKSSESIFETISYNEIQIIDRENNLYDALFAAVSSNANPEQYEIGRDVMKIGSNNPERVLLRSEEFGVPLCAIDVPYKNKQATVPLIINTPEIKEYVITLQQKASNCSSVYLMKQHSLIAELSPNDSIIIKGNGNELLDYSLRMELKGATNDIGFKAIGGKGDIVITDAEPEALYTIFDAKGSSLTSGYIHIGSTIVDGFLPGVYLVEIEKQRVKVVVR